MKMAHHHRTVEVHLIQEDPLPRMDLAHLHRITVALRLRKITGVMNHLEEPVDSGALLHRLKGILMDLNVTCHHRQESLKDHHHNVLLVPMRNIKSNRPQSTEDFLVLRVAPTIEVRLLQESIVIPPVILVDLTLLPSNQLKNQVISANHLNHSKTKKKKNKVQRTRKREIR
jgi:hypothetical protein